MADVRAVGKARAEEATADEGARAVGEAMAEEARLDLPVPSGRGVEELRVLAQRLVRPHDAVDVVLVPRQRGQGERCEQGHGARPGAGSSSEGWPRGVLKGPVASGQRKWTTR